MAERRRIFVCSRYRGDVRRNVRKAEALCRWLAGEGHAPFAPHLFCPQFLDDADRNQRAWGIAIGLSFMEVCDEVLVCTEDGVSEGMQAEILHAQKLGKPIRWIGPEWKRPS